MTNKPNLRKPAWVRVAPYGQQICVGVAHTDRRCPYLTTHYSPGKEIAVIPVSGPLLNHVRWCERCIDPTAHKRKKRGTAPISEVARLAEVYSPLATNRK